MFRLLRTKSLVHGCLSRNHSSHIDAVSGCSLSSLPASSQALLRRPQDLRVAVAISGGVDSAVLLGLLQKEGYNVIPIHMINWDKTEENDHCTSEKDLFDAREVAKFYDLSLKEVNFVKHYWNDVFEDFIEQYQLGITPNPDIKCNEQIKFGRFYDYAINQLGCDLVATGHYGRIAYDTLPALVEPLGSKQTYSPLAADPMGKARLLTSIDPAKDQTYFLSTVNAACLQRVLLPMGAFRKSQIRVIARDLGVPVFKKKDSYGICFVGKKTNFKQFLKQYIPETNSNDSYDMWSLDLYLRAVLSLPDVTRNAAVRTLRKSRQLISHYTSLETSRKKFCKSQSEVYKRDEHRNGYFLLGLAALRAKTEKELHYQSPLLGCTENEWIKLDEASGKQGKLVFKDRGRLFGLYSTESSELLSYRSSFVVKDVKWATPVPPELPVQQFEESNPRTDVFVKNVEQYAAQSVAQYKAELEDPNLAVEGVHPPLTAKSVEQGLHSLFPLSDYKVLQGERLYAKTSSTGALCACVVAFEPHGETLSVRVEFEEPVQFPAPGQTCVLYRLQSGTTPSVSAVPAFESMGLTEDADTTQRQAHLGSIKINGETKKLGPEVLLECLGAGVIQL